MIDEINYQADILGMDTISLGGTIAFAMELKERGMADFGLEFGKTDNLLEVIKKIAYREGIYSELADGSKILSEKYGGKEFAMHAKGLEMASYEPRRSTGMGLGYATANRGGCHLNGGYMALMESVGVMAMDPQTSKGKPELTVSFKTQWKRFRLQVSACFPCRPSSRHFCFTQVRPAKSMPLPAMLCWLSERLWDGCGPLSRGAFP